jgi:5'-nucleotidase
MMRILLTNDDGVYARGLEELYEGLKDLAEVTVIAPLVERSTTGHTLSQDNPMRIVPIKKNVYGCTGFPADCTLLGIGHIYFSRNQRPDLVISGVNRGANLGQDVYYSGTVAGAREAAFHDIPAIAVSTASAPGRRDPENFIYHSAVQFIRKLILHDFFRIMDPLTLININVPNLPFDQIKGIEMTRLGLRKYSEKIGERFDFRNKPYYWIVGHYEGHELVEGSDTAAIENQKISVTPLNLLHQRPDKTSKLSAFLKKLGQETVF